MAWWVWTIIGVYGLGFIATYLFNAMGMVTLELMLLRSFVWPIWWGTRGRWPAGVIIRPD